MELEIRGIRNPGNIADERLVLRAVQDLDIGQFVIVAARARDREVVLSGQAPFSFWLPDREIKARDLIVVYTKSGSRSNKKNDSGATSYFEYWKLAEPIWGDRKLKPVLMKIAQWESASISEPAAVA